MEVEILNTLLDNFSAIMKRVRFLDASYIVPDTLKSQTLIACNKQVVDNLNIVRQNFLSRLDQFQFDEILLWHKKVQDEFFRNFHIGNYFNVFTLFRETLGFNIQETMHSRLLKFLIDPSENHGQGSLFLHELLLMLNVEDPKKGNWKVTAELGRIDILIERSVPQCIIVIENKSNWAVDQKNQMYRYWYRAIYLKTLKLDKDYYLQNSQRFQVLYLTPNNLKQAETHSFSKPTEGIYLNYDLLPSEVPIDIKTITFDNDIQNWLDNCIAALPINNHRIKEYLYQYQMLCKQL